MTQIRTELSKNNPLYIDKFAFRTAYYFALQYPKWKRQYAESIGSVIKAVDYNDSPKGNGTGDPTARIAMRTSILHSNIELIECTALMAGRDMAEYILYAVTNEGVTYNYLHNVGASSAGSRADVISIIRCGDCSTICCHRSWRK